MAGWKRRLRVIGLIGAILLVTAFAAMAGAVAIARSDAGRVWIAAELGHLLSEPGGYRVVIAGVEGDLPRDIRLKGVSVSDPQGQWLAFDAVTVRWSPSGLFAGVVHLPHVAAGGVRLLRLPGQTSSENDSSGPTWPVLPLAVVIDRFAVTDLFLGAGILGETATLRAQGAVAADGVDGAVTSLSVRRTDAVSGELDAKIRFKRATRRLDITLTATEPGGGVLARMLALPALPPVTIRFDGGGPLRDWRGRLAAELGAARVAAEIVLTGKDDVVAELHGRADIEPLVSPDVQALVAGGIDFEGRGRFKAGEMVEIGLARIASAAGSGDISATIDIEGKTVRGRWTALLTEGWQLPAVVEPVILSDASLQGEFAGPLQMPRVTAELALAQIGISDASAQNLHASLAFQPTAPLWGGALRGRVEAQGAIESVQAGSPDLARLFRGPLQWRLRGVVDGGARLIELTDAAVATAAVEAKISGWFDAGRLSADTVVGLEISDLAALSPLAGIELQGRARVDGLVRLQAGGKAAAATVGIDVGELGLADPRLAALLGRRVAAAADLRFDHTGRLTIEDLALDGRNAMIRANGEVGLPDGEVGVKYRIAVPDLAVLSKPLGQEIGGRARAEGTVRGSLSDPALDLALTIDRARFAETDLGDVRGTLVAQGLGSEPRGRIDVSAQPLADPVKATSEIALAGGRLALTKLRVTGRNLRAEGGLDIPIRGGGTRGDVALEADNIANWLAMLGIEGKGALSARVSLSDHDGHQAVALAGKLQAVSASVAPGQNIDARTIEFDMKTYSVKDPVAAVATATATDLRFGPALVHNLTLNADIEGKRTTLRLRGEGAFNGPISVDAEAAALRDMETLSVRLDQLSGRFRQTRFALAQPLRIVWERESVMFGDLRLRLADGEIAGDGQIDRDDLRLNLTAERLSLAMIRPAVGYDADGTVSGHLSVSGTVTAPDVDLQIALAEVHLPGMAESPALAGALSAVWRNQRVDLAAKLSGLAVAPVVLSATLPLQLARGPWRLTVPANEPLLAHLAWNGGAAPVAQLLLSGDHHLSGQLNVDLRLDGTRSAPSLRGGIDLTGGEYENLTTGTLLQDLALSIVADGAEARIRHLTANDGGTGSVTGRGKLLLDFDRQLPFSIDLELREMLLVRRDDVTAGASGTMTLEGSSAAVSLKTHLETSAVEARLINQLPPEVTELAVTEVGGPTLATGGRNAAPEDSTARPVDLDLEILMPRRVFVRGRGLDSEWAGDLRIAGTAAEPLISGRVSSVRGQLSFLGKVFRLMPSTVSIDPSKDPIDPVLDVAAEYTARELSIVARMTGPASQPTLLLRSEPELPQDEILSHLLFGKAAGQLTAFEAVRLAGAAAELSGAMSGVGGIFDVARRTLGVDVLQVVGGSESTGGPKVRAGKYLSEQIYVGVEQGATAQGGAAQVEIEVTPHLSVESELDQTGGSNIGVKVQWDY